MPVTEAIRALVFQRAAYRCEYCLIRNWWLEVDHVIPSARWIELGGGQGLSDLPNLAAACTACNNAKRDHIVGVDDLTGTIQLLFNPRTQTWPEHFAWTEEYEWIFGVTPVGRATVARLKMNRPIYRRQRQLLRLAMRSASEQWP